MYAFEPKARATPRTAPGPGAFGAARMDVNRDARSMADPRRASGSQAEPRAAETGEAGRAEPPGASPPLAHDFARIPLYAAGRSDVPRGGFAQPVSDGYRFVPEEPFGDFNEEQMDTGPALAATEPPLQAGAETPATPVTPAAGGPAQPAQAVPGTRTVIRGPREMWNFDGATPPNYTVSARLSTNRTGGAFRWSVSPNLSLSSAVAAAPTVTTVAPSVPPGRDAVIALRHTDAAGATTAASYRLTILAPESLNHLRNVDNAVAGLVAYQSEIHYSILDQFGTVLPRNVPLNEQFTGPSVPDFPGGNWTPPPACGPTGVCGASFNPADFHDAVTGEGDAGAVPTPVAPTHPDAAVPAEHWPGHWFVGASPSGTGRRVRSVNWQRNRGFARHT